VQEHFELLFQFELAAELEGLLVRLVDPLFQFRGGRQVAVQEIAIALVCNHEEEKSDDVGESWSSSTCIPCRQDGRPTLVMPGNCISELGLQGLCAGTNFGG
jgi:hypothetical protein